MPLVSIITTSYKHEKFIKDTIESILSQTFSDWELLIGDDSPNDETRNIIQHYVKKHPDKIRARHHSPSKHIVGNTNFLLSKTSVDSQYLTFLE
jgi:teichuronic acid biosynthesis glycosyltransferase TuaG